MVFKMLRVLLTACTTITIIPGIYAQQLIGPSPETQAVLIGTDHTLTCRRGDGGESGSIVFGDATDPDADPTNIFINGGKETNDLTTPKYSNFNSDPANPYDVVITNIAVEDEGTYTCRNNFYSLTITATRTVEVPLSAFDLTQDGSGTELVTVRAGVPSDIVCTAIGARPVVTILWFHAKDGGSETPITEGIIQDNTVNGDTTDSVSTLTYTATDDYDAGSLRCKTTGQLVAESREDTASLNVQYVPVVDELSYADNTVTCKPRGNPEITQVRIYVNGTEYTPTQDGTTYTLSYTVKEEITIRCNATNTLGTGTDTVLAEPGIIPLPTTVGSMTRTEMTLCPIGNDNTINVAAIILGVLLLISVICIVILAYVVYRLVKNKNSSVKAGVKKSSTPNAPQTYMELNTQTRQPESTYEQPKTNDPKDSETAQAYMDLNPHTRDEKTEYQDLNLQEKSLQRTGNSAYEEIQETKNTQAYVNIKVDRPQKAK